MVINSASPGPDPAITTFQASPLDLLSQGEERPNWISLFIFCSDISPMKFYFNFHLRNKKSPSGDLGASIESCMHPPLHYLFHQLKSHRRLIVTFYRDHTAFLTQFLSSLLQYHSIRP